MSASIEAAIDAILAKAIADRIFPGAVVEVGRTSGPMLTRTAGGLSYDGKMKLVTAASIYDLASLTKVLATAPLMADEIQTGRMRLNDRVRHWIDGWTGEERQPVTLRDLLEHCSGLPAHRRYYETRRGRASFEMAICEEPLEYAPRTRSIYSDPGFMLLGFAMQKAAGAPLDAQFDRWRARELGADVEIRYRPDRPWFDRIAPTEMRPDGELCCGEVHDENADALDGVAAHAGLFGTASAVGACARWWMRSPVLPLFAARSSTPNSSRALAWDTMLPTSSCGTKMSPGAIGHTGFTGTSLWIDPAADMYVVFLTNRVHPSRERDGIQEVRRALHDAIVTGLQAGAAGPAGWE
jgi:CubicO group peptidase (beta-lactamase class C family)